MATYRTIAKEIDEQRFLACLLLCLFWPFIGTILGLLLVQKPSFKCILLGIFVAVIGLNTLYVNVSGDAVRYAMNFSEICRHGLNINNIVDEGRLDILPFLSMKIVSWFSSEPCVLFAFWGFVWGVFAYLTCHTAAIISPQSRFYMIAFMLILFWVNAPTNMHTYRFFVDVWIFLYFFLKAEISSKKKWMLFMLITPFVHTAFLIPVIIYYSYRLLLMKNISIRYLTVIFVICFAIVTFDNITKSLTSYGYLLMDTKYAQYLSEKEIDALAVMQEESNAKVQFARNMTHYGCFFIIMMIQYTLSNWKNGKNKTLVLNLDRLLLIFASFSYLVSTVPSMGRFLFITYILLVILSFYLISLQIINRKWFVIILILICFMGTFYLSFAKMPERYSMNFLMPITYLTPLF